MADSEGCEPGIGQHDFSLVAHRVLREICCGLYGNSSPCFYPELSRSEDQTIIERQNFLNTMIVRNRKVQRIRAAELGRELGNEIVCQIKIRSRSDQYVERIVSERIESFDEFMCANHVQGFHAQHRER